MRKEEFLSFVTDALEQMIEEKGYSEATFDSESGVVFKESSTDSESSTGGTMDSKESTSPVSTSSNSVFNTNPASDDRKAFEVSDSFTDDLFKSLLNKFKPSEEVRRGVFDKKQSFENISDEVNTVSFGGSENPYNFSYTRYEKPLEIPEEVVVDSTGDMQSVLNSFNFVLEYIMTEVERIYGGRDRITDIAVYSDVVIINKVSFEPLLKESLIDSLPYDLQYSVRNGCFAYLFDFSYLRVFKNLVNFSVDSVEFLYSKVRIDLGKGRDFEPKDLFAICKKLNTLRVGDYVITRQNRNAYSDVFKVSRRRTEIADKLEDLGFKGMMGTWSCARDIFLDKNSRLLWKGIKLAVVTGTATTVTVATLGFKLARTAGEAGKSVIKGVGNIVDAIKYNS